MSDEDYPAPTEFPPPKNATKFGKGQTGSVVTEAWFDNLNPQRMNLWLRAKDGDLVCVPFERLGILKKLLRRGRNP